MKNIRKLALSAIIFVCVLQLFSLLGVVQGKSPFATDSATWRVIKTERLQELKEEREQVRIEIRERKEEASAAARLDREEFKERLAEIKNARKRLTVQRIDISLEAINNKWIDHWNRVLDRLSELLAKVESRADKAEAAGKDVSDVRDLIVAAGAAIDAAQEEVNSQAENVYVIEIDEEENLGTGVSTAIKELKDDLGVVREAVKAAHDAVRDVLRELKGIPEVDEVESEIEE